MNNFNKQKLNGLFLPAFIFTVTCVFADFLNACTAFVCNDKIIQAFDWSSDIVRVVYTPIGIKRSALGRVSFGWKTKYTSFSLTQFHNDLPQSGMNDQGLVIVGLQQDDAAYPSIKAHMNTLNELQVIQYALDSFATVQQVIEAFDSSLQISKFAVSMHYLVHDKEGDTAFIEFIDGKIVVTKSNNVKVLTNSSYAKCMAFYEQRHDDWNEEGMSKEDTNCDEIRFSKTANAISKNDTVDEIFSNIVIPAKQTLSETWQGVKFHTRWKVIFDPKVNRIDFAFVNENYSVAYNFNEPPKHMGKIVLSNPKEDKKGFRPANWNDTLAQSRAIVAMMGQCIQQESWFNWNNCCFSLCGGEIDTDFDQ